MQQVFRSAGAASVDIEEQNRPVGIDKSLRIAEFDINRYFERALVAKHALDPHH